jgi:D-alanine-D-alanine ligase
MKVTILTYLEREGDKDWDPVVEQVAEALREGGHKASVLGAHGDLKRLLSGLAQRAPDLVFNLMEMFGGDMSAELAIAGLLQLLKLRHTGNGPGEHYLQQDKALTKKLLAFDNILYPDFAVFSRDASLETGGKLRWPLFVKPLQADASIGIDGRSLVRSSTDLLKRVTAIHEEVHDSALAEEYIEGREFYVGVLGNQEPQAFPPVEMDFSGLDEGQPTVLDGKAKWDETSAEYRGTRARLAELPDELRARLQRVALDAYRALRVRDYGRVDIRMTEAGEIYVIEVNASCYLERQSEFAMAAKAAGLEYAPLINRIVELAIERYSPK